MSIEQVQISLNAGLLQQGNEALQREWLVTNGIGGYASATVAGANTRRYHGLLVAALHAPLGRSVLLSKMDERLEVIHPQGQESYELSTNLYPGTVHPQGYRFLQSWETYPAPTWTWSPASGVTLEKQIWMVPGQNTTCISYTLQEAPDDTTVQLGLVPLLAWKDYHSEMHSGNAVVNTDWTPEAGCLRYTLPGVWGVTAGPFPLSMRIVGEDGSTVKADYRGESSWYYRFQHPREQERGLDCEEDLYAPGTLYIPLVKGQTVTIIASVEENENGTPREYREALAAHQADLLQKVESSDPFAEQLALAADQFIVQVPGRRSTVIAGYPWFSDWGRDTMIALPGLCLSTGRPEIAREILRSFAEFVDGGLLPNRFPDKGDTPEYNTVDATLWYFVALYRYAEATGDNRLVTDELWGVLEGIIQKHFTGTRYQIHASEEDGLLYAGEPGVQLTWMDAKVGDWVVTPRIGKPVEINALWLNALRTMEHFARLKGDSTEPYYQKLAVLTEESFRSRFARTDGKGLYDVLDFPPYEVPDSSVRPNQIFALSLPFAPVDATSDLARSVVQIVQEELYTPFGMRTLSPRDPAYRPRYEGDPWNRDGAYHQGTAWPWLTGAFAEAHFKVFGDREKARAFLLPFQQQLSLFGMGSLAEVADGSEPQRPNGCIAQAWSIAETLRVWKLLA